MSYLAYKVLHVFGVLGLFLALGGLAVRSLDGATDKSRGSKLAGMTHGLALLVVLVSGFGLVAVQTGFAPWVWIKVVIWLLLGGVIALLRRLPRHAPVLWFTILLLGALAAYLALYQPAF